VPITLTERHDRDAQLLHQRANLIRGGRLSPGRKDHTGFEERRRRRTDGAGREDPIDEVEVPGLAEQDRDQRGRIERHTPLGP
jgi:hypothetical protein